MITQLSKHETNTIHLRHYATFLQPTAGMRDEVEANKNSKI